MNSYHRFFVSIIVALISTASLYAHSDECPIKSPVVKDDMRCAELVEDRIQEIATETRENAEKEWAADRNIATKGTPLAQDGSKRKIFLKVFSPDVWARAIVSGGTFGYALHREGKTLEQSIALGVTAGMLSFGFQILSPLYVDYLTKKGFTKLDRNSEAHPVENWLKEYVTQWIYFGVYQAVAMLVGVENQNLIKTVTLSWIMEGSWSILISKKQEAMQKARGPDSRLPEYFYRSAFLFQAFISSLLAVTSFANEDAAKMAYYILSAVGMAGYLWTQINWKGLFQRMATTQFWHWRSIADPLRARVKWEFDQVDPSGKGRRTCRNLLAGFVPFLRPVRNH